MPPALAAAARAAVDVARFETWRRDRLAHLISHFRSVATARALPLLPSRTPIQPLVIGASDAALAVAAKLEDVGFYVPAIRPPTVPEGKARLRIPLTALHSESDVERLADAIAEVLG
jgi:8-amino-7-oxononanoate synthase